MGRPDWFPSHVKSCVKAISILEEIPSEGIFFIKYPELWAEEITGLLNGFFARKAGKFVRFDDDNFSLSGEVGDEFKRFINETSFETGPKKYSLKIEPEVIKGYKIQLYLDEKPHNVDNPSHLTLLQSVRATYFLLQDSFKYVCFQMDTGCLDLETNKIIKKIFSYLHEKLKNTGKNLIVFYSDSSGEFTTNYLWKSNCYKSFAVIDQEDSYTILDYDDAIDRIKKAIEGENYKRIDLFLGAGASMKSGLPSGKTMMLKALQELTGKPNTENIEELLKDARNLDSRNKLPHDDKNVSLEHIMTLFQQSGKHDDLTQTEVIKDFEEKHKNALKNPSVGYNILKNIASKNVFVLAVTTNFDQLLELCLPHANVIVENKIYEGTDFRPLIMDSGGNVIIKLHGCRKFPLTLGIRIDNIRELPPPKKEFMREYLSYARPEGKFSPIFFIGYNFADPDILNELKKDFERLRIHPIIVNPMRTETIRLFMDEFERENCKSTHIPFTFDFFMEVVKEIFQDSS